MNQIIPLKTRYLVNLALEADQSRRRQCVWLMTMGAFLLGLCVLMLTSGCATQSQNPFATPAAITGDVRDTVGLDLELYPAAAGEVAAARDVICADAGSTNVNIQQVVADLQKAGITNQTAKIIVNGVLLVWNRVVPFLNQTNTQTYANAVCLGLQQATSVGGTERKMQRLLPPHLK